MNWLTEPWQYAFFRNGLAAGVMAGALCGLVGVYVVLRRMSYIGHGLSHAIFGGAAASYVIGVNFYLGAGLWGLVSALLINAVARRRKIGADAAIGIVTTASFADTFGTRPNQFTIDFVTIGNPANIPDNTGNPKPAGSVLNIFRIGQFEISRDMVAQANDSGKLAITVDAMRYWDARPEMPATGVSWNEAARFVNYVRFAAARVWWATSPTDAAR